MTPPRRIAVAAGVLYLVTHVTSIGGLVLYGPVLNNPNYIVSAGPDTRVLLGAFFEVILALAIVGTAVTLFPIVKRQNVFAWELTLAFWLIVKGFKPSPLGRDAAVSSP